jgi:predicted nucleic acid-binding protein
VLLVDTSAWIELLRRGARAPSPRILDREDVVTCPPVVQEVLQGIRDEAAFRLAREAFESFPIIESPLRMSVFEEAAGIFRTARRAGFTVRSGADCLVAACALRHGLPVLHRDRDFDLIARVTRLDARRIGSL